MESPFLQAVAGLFLSGWTMLVSVKFPGTELPIAVIIVGAFVISFAIRLVAYVLGMTVNAGEETGLNDMHREKVTREKAVEKRMDEGRRGKRGIGL